MPRYPLGKVSPPMLLRLLNRLRVPRRPDVLVGPGLGEDGAAVAIGDRAMVIATDPVTFAGDRAGWYAVHVNANDVATMGAAPRWFQACILMPTVSAVRIESVFDDIASACREVGAVVLGGHTEVTAGVPHPIVVGTMIGLVERGRLLRTAGARVGDVVVMTKSAAIEATSIMARHRRRALMRSLGRGIVDRAARFLFDPGISVVPEALRAVRCGATSMHDPTEGGVLAGLWEVAAASKKRVVVDPASIPIRTETRRLADRCRIDPLRAIASGSLLLTIPESRGGSLLRSMDQAGIPATIIGRVVRGRVGLFDPFGKAIPTTATDEITKLFA